MKETGGPVLHEVVSGSDTSLRDKVEQMYRKAGSVKQPEGTWVGATRRGIRPLLGATLPALSALTGFYPASGAPTRDIVWIAADRPRGGVRVCGASTNEVGIRRIRDHRPYRTPRSERILMPSHSRLASAFNPRRARS